MQLGFDQIEKVADTSLGSFRNSPSSTNDNELGSQIMQI